MISKLQSDGSEIVHGVMIKLLSLIQNLSRKMLKLSSWLDVCSSVLSFEEASN